MIRIFLDCLTEVIVVVHLRFELQFTAIRMLIDAIRLAPPPRILLGNDASEAQYL